MPASRAWATSAWNSIWTTGTASSSPSRPWAATPMWVLRSPTPPGPIGWMCRWLASYFVDVTDDRGLLAGLAHTVGGQSVTDPSPAIPVAAGQIVQNVDFGYVRLPARATPSWATRCGWTRTGTACASFEPVVIDTQICATPVCRRHAGLRPDGCQRALSAGVARGRLQCGPHQPAPGSAASPPSAPWPWSWPRANSVWTRTLALAQHGTLGTIGGQIWQDLPVDDVVDGLYDASQSRDCPMSAWI